MDADVKATPLKALQGLIWQEGFQRAELTAHVYDDVPAALSRWTAQGASLHVFSSGSVLAQKEWFSHTDSGDLLTYFISHFDTRHPGPKNVSASYAQIAECLDAKPSQILFCSDTRAELDAAREAGWRTLGVRRSDGPATDLGTHRMVASFDGIDITEPNNL
jgi:enolase-phosphatase E1